MVTTNFADPIALDAQHVLQIYKRAPVVFESGKGSALFTRDGERYLDLISGVGVASLGHGHPGLAHAIADQASTLLHTSNLFHHPLQGEVAARLSDLSGLPRAFFCNSGAEAVEACLKFARRYWYTLGTPRPDFVALTHSFHGRTMGAVSVTWDDHYRAPFGPLVPGVTFVDPSDPAAITAAITDRTAAVIVEPIQGEGGVRPLSQSSADAIRAGCKRTGALLISDEVQCGLGRTGRPFHGTALGLQPDLMALGKALGAGVPIGAALFSDKVAAAAKPGDHGSTYGGNLLACRAALVFLEALTAGGLMDHVTHAGAHLERGLRAIAARQKAVKDVRGAGVMWGLELDRPAAAVVDAARERRLLINRTSDTVVRLLPPFVITERGDRRSAAAARGGHRGGGRGAQAVNTTIQLRAGEAADAAAIHGLITANLQAGHLLPRTLEDVETHAGRFVVAVSGDGAVIGCGELAPLSGDVAEVRSLVVDEARRGQRTGLTLVTAIADRARELGYVTLCAFTHQPAHFIRLGFSIVPHVWVPEKIAHDCVSCSQFRRCGQYAVSLALRAGAGLRLELTAPPARAVAAPRASVERLRLIPIPA